MGRFHKASWFFLILFLLFLLPCQEGKAGERATIVPGTVRVGLMQQVPQVEFSVTGKYELIAVGTEQTLALLAPGEHWRVRADDGRLSVDKNGQPIETLAGPLQVKEILPGVTVLSGKGELINRNSGEGLFVQGAVEKSIPVEKDFSGLSVLGAQGPVTLLPSKDPNLITLFIENSSRRYRGSLEIRAGEKGLTVINELPLEKYLYGVVPAEMPATWPAEALQAQAVAARSYVLAQLGSYSGDGFDVLASQNNQVYGGYDWENPATTKAVEQTRGVILTYRGLPVNALFHSSSGGYTENSEEVWKDTLDYIRARPDPYDRNEKHYNWQVSYSPEQLKEQLKSKGYEFEEIFDLVERERTSTGKRVKCLAIKGLNKEGAAVVEEICNADRVRVALGLKSAFFTMEKEFDRQQKLTRVTFQGNGWGHGLGMSQYGALGMARQGYTYRDILQYYYSGVTIAQNYGG